MDTTKIQVLRLREILQGSSRIVFFGGAGVSTESGIPDFRSEQSRGATVERYGFAPETILSADFFWKQPQTFYRYVREFLYQPSAAPNAAHRTLAQLERAGKLQAVVTQNIDGLHQLAGSKRVSELHGTLQVLRCVDCGRQYGIGEAFEQLDSTRVVPLCSCGQVLKPDVVLYQEALPEVALQDAATAVQQADTLLIAGTSLAVYPAAGLVHLFEGQNLVVINLTETPADSEADLVIRAPVGEVLEEAVGAHPS